MSKHSSQSYSNQPPSYTSVPRGHSKDKRRDEDSPIDTKRLLIRGIQLVGVALVVYQMWQKHHGKGKEMRSDGGRDRDAAGGEHGRRRRADEWDGESMHEGSSGRMRIAGERYGSENGGRGIAHGSEPMYGITSEVGDSDNSYMSGSAGRRRRRREREGGAGRRIEYGEYRN